MTCKGASTTNKELLSELAELRNEGVVSMMKAVTRGTSKGLKNHILCCAIVDIDYLKLTQFNFFRRILAEFIDISGCQNS